jgi:hypothetical protein
MNNRVDHDNLLAEILAEASPADFRAAMLAETLRMVRRRRRFQLARQVAGVLSVMCLLVILAGLQLSRPTIISTPAAMKIPKPSYEPVRTQPMAAGALIATRKFFEFESETSVSKVIEVATVRGGFRLINDDELLALFADKPAVLIRTGPHSEELVFVNPDDQKLLQPN